MSFQASVQRLYDDTYHTIHPMELTIRVIAWRCVRAGLQYAAIGRELTQLQNGVSMGNGLILWDAVAYAVHEF